MLRKGNGEKEKVKENEQRERGGRMNRSDGKRGDDRRRGKRKKKRGR